MSEVPAQLAVGIVSAIFGAGVAWGIVRSQGAQDRRDLNAIGATMRRYHHNMLIALMVITQDREDRQRLADLLRQQ